MASVLHVAVGLAAGRAHPKPSLLLAMAGFVGLSMLPDADVIGFRFGVQYADPWGHRGASHSLCIAACMGFFAGLIAKPWGRTKTALLVFAVVASHGLLDTLTDGGLGIALLWPASNTRFFAPWQPIPVSPIGLAYLSKRGLYVAAVELAMSVPFFLYAFKRRRVSPPANPPESPRTPPPPP